MEANLKSKGTTKRRRMSDGSYKTYQYTRKQFDITFENEQEKLQFESRLESLKSKKGLKSVKEVFLYFFQTECCDDNSDKVHQTEKVLHSSLGDTTPENFVCENKCILELADSISKHGQRCDQTLNPVTLTHSGHVAQLEWHCQNGHLISWNSSSTTGSQYTVNYRIMLAYLCSGMNQIQYERFSEFSNTGTLTEHFRVQSALTFSAVIAVVARESIQFALFDEIQISKENKEDGISIMTDARHQCRKNSFHTDHVALGCNTHKVVDLQHVNKYEERSTQKHEVIGCEKMYEEFGRKNVKINVHTHDRNVSVNKVIRTKNTVKNCNERWHAAKAITKGMKVISSGAVKNIGRTWHPELADKGSLVRNHVYYSIDNCGGDPAVLRRMMDNCVLHFQNRHDNCAAESGCKEPGYVPEFIILREPVAVRLLSDFLHSTTLYKNAQDYVLNKDTFYVESFNNAVLMYLDKRLHYKDRTYTMRMNLAVLNWNEHVDRPFTARSVQYSEKNIQRRQLGKKHYKKKSYNFVSEIWQLFLRVIVNNEDIDVLDVEEENSDHYDETDTE